MREKFKELMFSGKETDRLKIFISVSISKSVDHPTGKDEMQSHKKNNSFVVMGCSVLCFKRVPALRRKFGSLKRFKKGQGHHVAIT